MENQIKKYKSIFVSDLHLGLKYSKVQTLLKFLKETDSENLFLCGDLIDGWALKRKWYWIDDYNLLIQKILRKARHGVNIFYLTGNHDDFLRKFHMEELSFGNIKIIDHIIHQTSDGKKYLVIHGDKFDGVMNSMSFISHFGSLAYDIVLFIDDKYNKLASKFGFNKRSLAKFVKHNVKDAVKYLVSYEKALIHEAKKNNVQGIICGHSHYACHKMIDGIEFWNCGSFLENNCSAIVEHLDGKMELVYL